jgi:preprotein translocase subunit YajC
VWNVVLAQTQQAEAPRGPASPPQGLQSLLGNPLFMVVAFMVIMYLFLLRPGQKREKERREMLASLTKGDQVVTSGGICGKIVGLREKTVVLCVNEEDNTKLEFLRSSISQVVSRGGDAK